METEIVKVSQWENLKKVIDWKINKEGFKPFKVILKKYKKNRTSKQLRYYWTVIHEAKKAFKECWGENLTDDQVHNAMKLENKFYTETILPNGGKLIIPKTLSDKGETSTKELNEQIEFIKNYCAQNMGYIIRD